VRVGPYGRTAIRYAIVARELRESAAKRYVTHVPWISDFTGALIHHLVLAPSSRIRATSSGASKAVKCPLWRSTMPRAPGTDSMLA
jgi:hypothetical protein